MLNSEKFHIKGHKGKFLDFYDFTLYTVLAIFLKLDIMTEFPIMGISVKNLRKRIKCESVKIQIFTIFIIFISKISIKAKKEKFEISQNSA